MTDQPTLYYDRVWDDYGWGGVVYGAHRAPAKLPGYRDWLYETPEEVTKRITTAAAEAGITMELVWTIHPDGKRERE